MIQYSGADRPQAMTWRQWHWLRKHRPEQLAALIRDDRAGDQ